MQLNNLILHQMKAVFFYRKLKTKWDREGLCYMMEKEEREEYFFNILEGYIK